MEIFASNVSNSKNIMQTTDHPTVSGTVNQRRNEIRFPCPWCKGSHFHGWEPHHEPGHREHRVSHCHHPEAPRAYWAQDDAPAVSVNR